MLNIQLRGDRELVQKYQGGGERARREITKAIVALQLKLEHHIKADKLSGQVLHVVSGDLRASIFSKPIQESGDTITGYVASSGDVKYAAIHEFGGTIPHPGGTPYMNFQGQTFFVSLANAKNLNLPVTKAHAIPMPQRSFMRSALADMSQEIRRDLDAAAHRSIL